MILDYEQKYKEALERARDMMSYKEVRREDMEYIFPELKVSDDERIRKELIDFVKSRLAGFPQCKKYITWLEKQGEQKSVDKSDKVDPIFHEGDWVVTDLFGIVQIKAIENGKYVLENTMRFAIDGVDNFWYRWTIEYAKDGDVLYSLDSCQPFIYKGRKSHEQATAYCGINKYGRFFVGDTKDCIIVLDNYVPATKEQCDTLERAMTNAGYRWNKEELKLEKI